jgi:hypothetical protein
MLRMDEPFRSTRKPFRLEGISRGGLQVSSRAVCQKWFASLGSFRSDAVLPANARQGPKGYSFPPGRS